MRHEFVEDNNFTEDMPFGEFLRKKRRLMGYNQSDFSEILGIDQGTLSAWELRVTSPPIDKAKSIIKKLGGRLIIANMTTEDPLGFCPHQE